MKFKIIDKYYEVIQGEADDPEFFGEGVIGCPVVAYTNKIDKQIVLIPRSVFKEAKTDTGWRENQKDSVLHELIHAYCYETGACYDEDEALVEWIARNIHRICNSYDEIMASEVWK